MSKERFSQGPAKVIADAFETVSLSAAYRGRRLPAYDYVSILSFEYDLASTPDAALDSAALVTALDSAALLVRHRCQGHDGARRLL